LRDFPLKLIFLYVRQTLVGAGIALRAGRPRDRSSSPGMVKNFLFSTLSRPGLGSTQSPIHLVLGAISLGVKRPGRDAGHSPPDSA
jgi:hypothetical protein